MYIFNYKGWNCHMTRQFGGFVVDIVSIEEVSKMCGHGSCTIDEFREKYNRLSNRNTYSSHRFFNIYQLSLRWDVAQRNAQDYIDENFGSAPNI